MNLMFLLLPVVHVEQILLKKQIIYHKKKKGRTSNSINSHLTHILAISIKNSLPWGGIDEFDVAVAAGGGLVSARDIRFNSKLVKFVKKPGNRKHLQALFSIWCLRV